MSIDRRAQSATHSGSQRVRVLINGALHEVADADLCLSLSDYLRRRAALVGTKVVCAEGDCGACTVLLTGPLSGERSELDTSASTLDYRAVDSCILYMHQLHRCHVVTVEGVPRDGELSPLQQALVDGHGSQCGFCTPGFVMSLTGVLEDEATGARPCAGDASVAISGNLCRCTGYIQILEAFENARRDPGPTLAESYPTDDLLAVLEPDSGEELDVTVSMVDGKRRLLAPASLERALELKSEIPDAVVLAGASDLGVRLNKGQLHPGVILDLSRVAELDVVVSHPGRISLGARATWTRVERALAQSHPEFTSLLELFGAPQIRNVGTVGGNLVNASPIADSLPFFYVCDAEVELASVRGRRRVAIQDFYRGYKTLDLDPDELLVAVHLPELGSDDVLKLFKVSRRFDLDISTFGAAVRLRLDDDRCVLTAAIAFGGVGPTVVRAPLTEDFLVGKRLDEETAREAGEVAVREVTPIDDVRGSRAYRIQLTRGSILRVAAELDGESRMVPA